MCRNRDCSQGGSKVVKRMYGITDASTMGYVLSLENITFQLPGEAFFFKWATLRKKILNKNLNGRRTCASDVIHLVSVGLQFLFFIIRFTMSVMQRNVRGGGLYLLIVHGCRQHGCLLWRGCGQLNLTRSHIEC